MENERILVVDDNPDNLELVRIVLECAGDQVRTAEDAREAMEALGTWRPDLILVDIQLPEVDGLELTRRLRANPAWRDISIVALTAYAMTKDEENARAAGCDGYITKPIDTRTFVSIVHSHLQRGKGKYATAPAL